MFDVEQLQLYVQKGLLTVQKHPTADLYIWNYSNQCQYERAWDEITLACRGLILDGEGNVVARPFPKFFNLEEHSRSDIVFSKPFRVSEKMDGSLGIMYRIPGSATHVRLGQVGIATRGSFTSDQALYATDIYNEKYYEYQPAEGTTPLFEIIYPTNRIVVDYGGISDLFLLTVIDNKSGRDIPDTFWFGPRAKNFTAATEDVSGTQIIKPREVLERLNFTDDGNAEGVVLIFDWPKTGPKTRVKVKLEEYKRLHKIVTGVSTKTIWEFLKEDRPLDELLDRVPDEFFSWVTETAEQLRTEYNWMLNRIYDEFDLMTFRLYTEDVDEAKARAYCKANRKDFAACIKDHKNKGFFFSLLDDMDITSKVWDLCRPTFERPFSIQKSDSD